MNKWKAVRFRSIHRPSGPKSAAALTASALAVLLLVLAAVVPSSAGGAMRYVDGADGSDTGDCANAASPCQTIAYAIGQAAADDVVAVAGGVYQENLHVDKMLTLQGGYEPAGWTRDIAAHETVIDGSGSAPAIGDWDGRFVKKPAVIKDADLYKMWYDGGNLVGDIAVGLAISGDGVSWKKAEQNPVLEANASGWEAGGNEFGTTVIKDNGTYKMWYERDGEGGRQLGYATSSNGIDWDKYAANPVLSPGPDGFDANGVGHGSVIKVDDTYKLWYHANGDQGPVIAYATSTDGVHWSKHGPVLGPQGGAWDEGGLWGPSVLKQGDTYWMWYSAFGPLGPPAIGAATSADGMNWTRTGAAPVLSEDSAIGDPQVLANGDTLMMWYNNFDEGVIKFAESADGVNWTPFVGNPVLAPGDLGAWGDSVVSFADGSGGSVLDGFTVSGGRSGEAGGVDGGGGPVTIRNCLIRDNLADGMPDHSGGGGVNGWDLTIEDSVIIHNEVRGGAGGVRTGEGRLTLVNTVVAFNTGDPGIHANGDVALMNSTVAFNDGGVLFNPPRDEFSLDVTNSIIWNNQWSIDEDTPGTRNVVYSIVQDGWPGEGNLDTDPLFVDPDMADLHLLPWSPAIDAGTATGAPDHDLDGNARPLNDGFDIGAYEFTGTPITNEGDRYVALSGSDEGPNLCLDPASPCASIGHGVNMAQNGETIWLAPDVFPENVEISGKEITLSGGWVMPAALQTLGGMQTIVDGTHSGRTFRIHDGSSVTLENMRIINGVAPEEACWGAGVDVTNAAVTIRHVYVHDNQALCSSGQSGGGAGGGLNAVQDEGPVMLHVEDSWLYDNEAGDHGSALATDGATVVFTNVVAYGNNRNVLALNHGDFRMVNSTIAANGTDGSALLDFDSDANIGVINSIFWHAGSVDCGRGGGSCDVTYSDVEGGWSGEGNIAADPRFQDPATADFRLDLSSPALDAGTPAGAPTYDILGKPRDGAPDMGAYEWQGAKLFMPLLQWPQPEGGVNRLLGHWTGALNDFTPGALSATALIPAGSAPFAVVFNSFAGVRGRADVYHGTGYAAVGEGAALAPMAAQANDIGGGRYDLLIVGSRVPDCFSADHDAELHFRKEGNTITFFEPAG